MSEDPTFQKRLDEDAEILKRLQELQDRRSLTSSEEDELSELHHKYYVTNDDIRRYWKTY